MSLATATAQTRATASRQALAHPVRTLLLGYAASRVLVLLVLWAAAHWSQNPAGVGHLHPGLSDMFGLWDGAWYQRVVDSGYPVPLPADPITGRLTYSTWAFYPLFPLLLRPIVALGVPFVLAGSVLSTLLGAAAVVAIWAVLRHGEHAEAQPERERLALVAALLWCFSPATAVLVQPYSEALAVLLVALCLHVLMQRRYLAAAVISLLLGLTRGVAPALGVVVLVHLVARWREERAAGLTPLRGSRTLVSGWGGVAVLLLSSAVSGLAWPAIAGWASGIPTAFFDVQFAWGQRPTEGPFVLWLLWAWDAHGAYAVAVLVATVATYLALTLGRHGRWLSMEVRAWAIAYPLYLFAVVRPITSMWRFLLLDFPAAALVASVAMRTSTGARVVPNWRRRVVLVVLVLSMGVVWWTVTIWPFAPWASRPP